ncbi:hypothetical protein os4_09010 [Comamonadaceae bacterium OS-4]|nr:hypothetical protein os4_09010 [Comamonadaceae bacterium OS-4]
MSVPPKAAAAPHQLAFRRAARSLIAATLAEWVIEEEDWLGACRKRIKDRMSDAKHMAFNNQRKIGWLLLGRTDEIPALEDKNRQLEHAALVCEVALEILDDMATARTPPAPVTPQHRALPARTVPAARRETAASL